MDVGALSHHSLILYICKMFKSPFAIVTTSNAILAICAAVVLGISAYVEHTVSLLLQSLTKTDD
jgi:uncharacterized membrane protein YczE